MSYGFVIDNRTCIGCHACSTACKSENDVPVGINRTWVKYTEVGHYPEVKRGFQVTRCNHCENPPCVSICPTESMFKRDNGIVDFDPEVCIGCKGCIQACPYDAIDIDPVTSSASKCNFCAHRTEVGLEPACVVVCPTHSIIAGDMKDKEAEISKVLKKNPVSVRKPEQGTSPKLFYIEGDAVSLTPTSTTLGQDFMWSERISEQNSCGPMEGQNVIASTHMTQVAYNAQHKIHWHWPVPAYFVTKGIGTGLFMLLSLFFGLGWLPFNREAALAITGSSLFFILATTALLVLDLEHPKRFLYIIFRPQWKSWLTRGAFILIAFSTLTGLWFTLEFFYWFREVPSPIWLQSSRPWVYFLGFFLGTASSVYTAFLFGQAEGRDLWQSPLFPFHLIIHSFMSGSAFILMLSPFIPLGPAFAFSMKNIMMVTLLIDLLLIWSEFSMSHASEVATRAAKDITQGSFQNLFWVGAIFIGHCLPLLLGAGRLPYFEFVGPLGLIIGLFCYEYAYVVAPQKVPNS
ncbi:MAG: 4Fe-4S dicluster domain-containing protein [Bdellovibrionota bacterium]|nr:4Fe-4S dicluster domain-containing protein [Bdellovibrionota bacterium]